MPANVDITRARWAQRADRRSAQRVVSTTRKTGTNDAGQATCTSERYDLVAVGQRAPQWASLEKGAILSSLRGEMRHTPNKLQFVAWEIETAPHAEPASDACSDQAEAAAGDVLSTRPEATPAKQRRTASAQASVSDDPL